MSKNNKYKIKNEELDFDLMKKAIRHFFKYIGDDPNREGLSETPERVMRSWDKLFGGYRQNPDDIMTVFEDDKCDEIIILKDIEFYSTCEHHILNFSGKIHIGYLPDKKIIGISKLARLVEIFSRRLQIQERLVNQIADCLNEKLEPKGVMVVCEAQHLCMTSRGIEKQNSIMVTSAIRGVFRDKNTGAREEFMGLIK